MKTWKWKSVTLFRGDCREIMPGIKELGCCITDPPYPREFMGLYGDIARCLKFSLVRGGSLMAIIPHYAVAEIMPMVGEHLKFRWMMCMWQNKGQHPRMAMGVEVCWKPIGWWVKDCWPNGRGFTVDGYENSPPRKKHHKWEQSLGWAQFCLRVCYNGGTVLDPLLGGGTTGVACVLKGIPFIGIEKDAEAFDVARDRIRRSLEKKGI